MDTIYVANNFPNAVTRMDIAYQVMNLSNANDQEQEQERAREREHARERERERGRERDINSLHKFKNRHTISWVLHACKMTKFAMGQNDPSPSFQVLVHVSLTPG